MLAKSLNRPNRDSQQELLARISQSSATPLHKDLLDLISFKLDLTKDKLINCPASDLLNLQGQAKGLHDLLTDLTRPMLSDILKKKEVTQ